MEQVKMKNRSLRILTALILSVVLVFSVVPQMAFADGEEPITVYVTIANNTFTEDLIFDGETDPASSPWTGSIKTKLVINPDETLAEAIEGKIKDKICVMDISYGFVNSINGLGEAGVWPTMDGSYCSWSLYYNNTYSSDYGCNNYVNGSTDVSGELSTHKIGLKNGDKIGIYYSIDGTVDNPYLFTPYSVTAKSTGYNKIQLDWKGYESAKESWGTPLTPSTYEIYRSENPNQDGTKIGTVKSYDVANSFVDSTVKVGKTYYYKIKTVKANNNISAFSNVASAKTSLNKPVIKVTKKGKKSLKVSWKKVDGAEKYEVYRATKKNGKYKKVKTVSSNKLSYTNKKLKKGKKYYYKVRAVVKVDGVDVKSSFSAKKSKKR